NSQPIMIRSDEEQHQALRSTWISVWVNLGLALAQVWIGIVARSQALIADGVHSLSDLVSDVLVLVAARHAQDHPDETHAYGHARFETAATLAIGLLLIGTGGGLLWSAAARLNALAQGAGLFAFAPAALLTALLTLVAKEFLFRYMRRVGERLQSAMLLANAWHARSDAVSSLVVAVGIAANLMGWHSMDTLAACVVGLMIIKAGWNFSAEAFRDLTDHALAPEEITRIAQTMRAVPGVRGLRALRTRRMGDWAVLDVRIQVDPHLTVVESCAIAEAVTARVKAAHRVAECLVAVEPLPLAGQDGGGAPDA
ncbi:cation diffusion facilitator family transporter, partial [Leptospira sp. SA-E8]|uniref:cation diffusion facilitator family transporter n=1 Tax=Leptospira sp. SA-E8 TaxID=3422259 RepID=UPI003EB95B48